MRWRLTGSCPSLQLPQRVPIPYTMAREAGEGRAWDSGHSGPRVRSPPRPQWEAGGATACLQHPRAFLLSAVGRLWGAPYPSHSRVLVSSEGSAKGKNGIFISVSFSLSLLCTPSVSLPLLLPPTIWYHVHRLMCISPWDSA